MIPARSPSFRSRGRIRPICCSVPGEVSNTNITSSCCAQRCAKNRGRHASERTAVFIIVSLTLRRTDPLQLGQFLARNRAQNEFRVLVGSENLGDYRYTCAESSISSLGAKTAIPESTPCDSGLAANCGYSHFGAVEMSLQITKTLRNM